MSRAYYLLFTAYCFLLTGCVERSLTIRSDPPGAQVYLNDQLLEGATPLTYDFQWYGGYRITLRKDGYERLDDRKILRAPPHLWIPFDLVMELVPFTIRDAHEWSYTLIPQQELPMPKPPPLEPTEKVPGTFR